MTTPDVPTALTQLHHEAVRATCQRIRDDLANNSVEYAAQTIAAAWDNPLAAQALQVACSTFDTAIDIVNAAEEALT